jgi:6-phosphofructokinase
MSSGKILVAQGGGPTAVINQSLAGVVLEARRFRDVSWCMARCMACAASSTKIWSI